MKTITCWLQIAALAVLISFLGSSSMQAITLKRVSVHDPSIVWEPSVNYYYIFGSHRGAARSKDLMQWAPFTPTWGTVTATGGITSSATNANAFLTNQTTTITIGGEEKTFGNFDALAWSSAYGGDYNIDGNMWAPDVIYNPKLEKWCMYLSINGPKWNSCIILLTSTKITGPYVYQGPVVFSGFNVDSKVDAVSYKHTDLGLALRSNLAALPSRYSANWGRRWPHAIDPCVFYDEEGKLWMSYGSWSGGIWILQLNEETGLRNYDVAYPSTNGDTDGVTSDPYFGKKIAGGFYSSGEGSYIEYIGGYYFLFVSNGGLAAGGDANDYNNGGYQMRVFRSTAPNGPYLDPSGRSAVLTAYELNFGAKNASTRGENIFGAYGDWGNMSDGERSQGHNSIIAADDGRTYLVYHTRFQNGGEGHQVRVHQVFQNQNGWLVAAPFEYTGEKVTSADIAETQQVPARNIPGTYRFLRHKYGLDHTKKELATPVNITLEPGGKVTGAYTGSWSTVEGTSYITVTIAGVKYDGVAVEQVMESKTADANSMFYATESNKVITFTAMATSGVTVWGQQVEAIATDISDVTPSPSASSRTVYDMLGRKVSTAGREDALKPGVYIVGGKKHVVK